MTNSTLTGFMALLLCVACSRPVPVPNQSSVPIGEVGLPGIPSQAADTLRRADSLELLALEPLFSKGPERFHNYRVLDRAPLVDLAERTRLLQAVGQGIAASDGVVAGCFNPRHGIRAERDGRRCDLVICFECYSMKVYDESGVSESVLTVSDYEPVVSAVYRAQGLALDGDPK